MHIHRVLHPTDFSESAMPAFERALVIADRLKAELHLFHVSEMLGEDPIRGAFESRTDEHSFVLDQWEGADQRMDGLVERAVSRGVKTKRVLSRGRRPASVILNYAADQHIDMIVMGTHGRRGFRRLVAGSVAMEVVRKAEVPVMTVGTNMTRDADHLFGKILVPVDFSEHARTALTLAQKFGRAFHSELTVLHVIEQPNVPAFYETSLSMFYGSMENITQQARVELEALSRETCDDPPPMSYEVRIGHVANEIETVSREIGADLIVLSTHGMTGMPRFFLGSVSERIIRGADVPVLRLRTIQTLADALGSKDDAEVSE